MKKKTNFKHTASSHLEHFRIYTNQYIVYTIYDYYYDSVLGFRQRKERFLHCSNKLTVRTS